MSLGRPALRWGRIGRPRQPMVDEAWMPPSWVSSVPGAHHSRRPPSWPSASLVSRHPLSPAFPALTVLGARRPYVGVLGIMAPGPAFPSPTLALAPSWRPLLSNALLLSASPSLSVFIPASLTFWNKKGHTCTGHHLCRQCIVQGQLHANQNSVKTQNTTCGNIISQLKGTKWQNMQTDPVT